ncbi:GNAT family N-acetyltransferase [Undibacterium curvum]|uniref:GNAT family N-acetyltransferase n=2 Tax=Undibacterium TaxID=401469 RepID=A0ABR7A3T6_9BURK|nr:GNAT family N-acetyltransferase [Undibacterium curvum]MBC3931580.1 GNAT family N-acetyltransferase [Undibacterium curvum]
MELVIREASPDDAQLIAHLTRSCWADKVAPTSSGHREATEQVQHELLQGGGFILYINDEPAGSVRWLPVDMDAGIWEMRRMGVLPAFRGQTLSQHLLEAVILAAQTAGVEELRLGVRTDQPRLLDLYAAYEFELAPELDYAHANPNEPKPNVMRRFLRN